MTTQEAVVVGGTNLRALVDTYYQTQKNRIAWGNRLKALEAGTDTEPQPSLAQAQSYFETFESLEDRTLTEIEAELETYAVWPWLKKVRGIGPTLAGKLLADIDIRKAERVSNLISFAGLAVVCSGCGHKRSMHEERAGACHGVKCKCEGYQGGKAPKPVKGEKLPYSQRLRTACFLVGRSFLMTGSPYKEIYSKAKEQYAGTRPDWTPAHRDMASKRKMMKVFLQHLWLKWREAEGLPISLPWVFEKGGHDQAELYKPEDFVRE